MSMEDDLMRIYGKKQANLHHYSKLQMERWIQKAQLKAENRNYSIRKRLIQYENVLQVHKEVIYEDRRKVLEGESLKVAKEFITYFCHEVVLEKSSRADKIRACIEKEEKIVFKQDMLEEVIKKIEKRLLQKEAELGKEKLETQLKKQLLKSIDTCWMQHLEEMEDMKNSMELRAYRWL